MAQRSYRGVRAPKSSATPAFRMAPVTGALHEAASQVETAFRAAANTMTFGGIDHFAAGMDALVAPGGLGGWEKRYRSNYAREQARNRYDAENRRTAQAVGQAAAVVLALMRGRAPSVRLPGAARLSRHEMLALLGAGAGTGAGVQVLSDSAANRRSSPGDLGGAALGGVAGVVALPLGAQRAGTLDGWVTSASQDVLKGRPLAFDQAGQSAVAGGVVGGAADSLGRLWSDSLAFKAKGRLGEALGNLRSTINGQRREFGPRARDALPGDSYWYPDGRSGDLRFEDKFGYAPELSQNQLLAQEVLGRNFALYHFTPDDIGAIVSTPASALSVHGVGAAHERRDGR